MLRATWRMCLPRKENIWQKSTRERKLIRMRSPPVPHVSYVREISPLIVPEKQMLFKCVRHASPSFHRLCIKLIAMLAHAYISIDQDVRLRNIATRQSKRGKDESCYAMKDKFKPWLCYKHVHVCVHAHKKTVCSDVITRHVFVRQRSCIAKNSRQRS